MISSFVAIIRGNNRATLIIQFQSIGDYGIEIPKLKSVYFIIPCNEIFVPLS